MNAIAGLLQRTMGLEAATIGLSCVERAVAVRLAQTGDTGAEPYLARLQADPAELRELIEEVVVPESWFFRDGAPFATLKRWTVEQWLPAHRSETLRVLTVPCSTGEEPYSVAMALLDAGLAPDRFSVHAVDISHRALARAQTARYRSNSFRGKSLAFRDQYFETLPGGDYALASAVRRQVRFEQGNLLAPGFLQPTGAAARYDVIFCRNVLIYFDRPTQARAVRTLGGLLTHHGLFFVGHAETGLLTGLDFLPTDHAMSFAFRKAPLTQLAQPLPVTRRIWETKRILSTPPPAPPRTVLIPPAPPAPARPTSIVRTRRVPSKTLLPPAAAAAAGGDALGEARRLADAGRLQEAARVCETHLREQGSSAAGWYLLGVVCDAAGDPARATECFAKTLYLDPGHQDALLQRTLLAEAAGDTAAATRLRSRLGRVQGRKEHAS